MSGKDFFSERMVFGSIVIVGFIAILHELLYEATHLAPEIVSLISTGVGALGAGVGIIVQSVFKVDKVDKQAADTAALLAAKSPDLSGFTPPAMAAPTPPPVQS